MAEIENIFGDIVKEEFDAYLQANPNNRRVTLEEFNNIIQWLVGYKKPQLQAEHSRRNYVKRAFKWDGKNLYHITPASLVKEEETKIVAVVDQIIYYVGWLHTNNLHKGWDATWKEVSTNYYGILRQDVIFLLKRCPTCNKNPKNQPKNLNKY